MAERQGVLRCWVDAGDPLLQVRPGGGIFAQVKQGVPERVMGLQEGRWHGFTLRQCVELFPQLPRCRQCPSSAIERT